MPNAVLRFCAEPGCPNKTPRTRCSEHERTRDQARGSASVRLYDHRWHVASRRFLARQGNQLCRYCEKEGRVTAANTVDHNPAHKGDPVKFWDRSTWVPSCADCNRRRNVLEEGGFGRPMKR